MVDGMSKGKRRHALPKRWFLGGVVKKVGAGRRVAGIHLRLVVFYSAGGVLPTTSPQKKKKTMERTTQQVCPKGLWFLEVVCYC